MRMGHEGRGRGLVHAIGIALPGLLVLASVVLVVVHPSKSTRADFSFSFTAAGDYAQTNYTTANLNYIAQSGASFNLALGDLNYDPTHVTAEQWSTYVKSHLPDNFPFEILAGNEDKTQLDALTANLPDHLGNISGTYAREYSFDYPQNSPLARFILASPGGIVAGYNYSKGSSHYNWVAQQIDGARNAGIPWVIVGIHEYCIVINSTVHSDPCTALDLTNLLLSKKVDLILYGHKHNFQVSKQLAFNSTPSPTSTPCASLTAGAYNSGCVADASTNLKKGAGSVMVVAGTGGETPLADIDTTDPEIGYFRNWEGSKTNPSWGISQFTVSKSKVTVNFVSTSGGTFTDSFTLTQGGATPVPTSTQTPTPAPGTTLARDTFQRADSTYWGTASDGQSWAGDANKQGVFSIKGRVGQIATSTSNNYNAILGPSTSNAQVMFSGSISTFTGTNLGAVSRWTDGNNWYRAYIDGTNLVIQKKVSGTLTRLKSVSFVAAAATSYTLRFSVVGTTLSAKAWQTGTTEPTAWQATATDSSLSAGYCGVRVLMQGGVTAQFTSFEAIAQ